MSLIRDSREEVLKSWKVSFEVIKQNGSPTSPRPADKSVADVPVSALTFVPIGFGKRWAEEAAPLGFHHAPSAHTVTCQRVIYLSWSTGYTSLNTQVQTWRALTLFALPVVGCSTRTWWKAGVLAWNWTPFESRGADTTAGTLIVYLVFRCLAKLLGINWIETSAVLVNSVNSTEIHNWKTFIIGWNKSVVALTLFCVRVVKFIRCTDHTGLSPIFEEIHCTSTFYTSVIREADIIIDHVLYLAGNVGASENWLQVLVVNNVQLLNFKGFSENWYFIAWKTIV